MMKEVDETVGVDEISARIEPERMEEWRGERGGIERAFITSFTATYTQLLHKLVLAKRYNDDIVISKQLIADCYQQELKPLCDSYFGVSFPDIIVTDRDFLDTTQTWDGWFRWVYWLLTNSDLQKGITTLLYALHKAV
jgi:hypothetical protein